MNNLELLNDAFKASFKVCDNELENLAYKSIDLWDSVGQMTLIANIEDSFDIMIESEDIMDINSYKAAKIILLEKYNIEF